jgi:hypothetical protein
MDYTDIMLPATVQPENILGNQRTDNSRSAFIEANTQAVTLEEIRDNHIIPVYSKDNEPLISHYDFIQSTADLVTDFFNGETVLDPQIRVSHPIKGRVPEARNKPASALQEWEKTQYYQRMAFMVEIPAIQDTIEGNTLSLTVGGVKAYNHDNLYLKKGADEHFKIFVGFQNKVCCNMCVWTDGYMSDVRVKDLGGLKMHLNFLLERYRSGMHLNALKELVNYSITEDQFAEVIGKCRMYPFIPANMKNVIMPLTLGDQQLGAVVRDYYRDTSFCRDEQGNINLWRFYNLLTGVNKSTYIDQYLDRSVNAYDFVEQIKWSLTGERTSWYLN